MTLLDEATPDEILMSLPAKARPTVAKARNALVRRRKAEELVKQEAAILKAEVRALRYRYGIGTTAIARALELSKVRIYQILGEKK